LYELQAARSARFRSSPTLRQGSVLIQYRWFGPPVQRARRWRNPGLEPQHSTSPCFQGSQNLEPEPYQNKCESQIKKAEGPFVSYGDSGPSSAQAPLHDTDTAGLWRETVPVSCVRCHRLLQVCRRLTRDASYRSLCASVSA